MSVYELDLLLVGETINHLNYQKGLQIHIEKRVIPYC